VAASLRAMSGISVADAHLGAAIHLTAAEDITVITSDPDDARRLAKDKKVTIVTI